MGADLDPRGRRRARRPPFRRASTAGRSCVRRATAPLSLTAAVCAGPGLR